MPNFETGVLRRSKSEVDLKTRVKIGPLDFWDIFEIFRKFREHAVSNFKSDIMTNGRERLFLILKVNKQNIFFTPGFPNISPLAFSNMQHIFLLQPSIFSPLVVHPKKFPL